MLTSTTLTMRLAADTDADRAAVARLAALDSTDVPASPVLVAEVDGEPQAALSLRDGSVAADPFSPTAQLVSLLRLHAGTVAERDADVRGERHAVFARRLGLAA